MNTLLLLASVADVSFHFPGGEIEQAGEQTSESAWAEQKKWGEVLPLPLGPSPQLLFFVLARSFVSFACFWK